LWLEIIAVKLGYFAQFFISPQYAQREKGL